MNPITGLLAALSAVTAVFVGGWWRSIVSAKIKVRFPNVLEIFIGAFTNFFDALGIGSYATTTSLFRFFSPRQVKDWYGRKCDGGPGVERLATCLRRLADIIIGWRLHSPENCWPAKAKVLVVFKQ